jgi:hypothetical protein
MDEANQIAFTADSIRMRSTSEFVVLKTPLADGVSSRIDRLLLVE